MKIKQLIQAGDWAFFRGLLAISLVLFAIGAILYPLLVFAGLMLLVFGLATAWLIQSPKRILYLYILALPFHITLITFLYGYLGLPANLARLIAAWKEIIGFLALIIAIMIALKPGRHLGRLTMPDFLLLCLLFLSTVYLLLGDLIFPYKVPITARLYGYRDIVFFLIFYIIGRLVPLKEEQAHKTLRLLGISAVIVSMLGFFERFFLSTDNLLRLGVGRYYSEFLGWDFSRSVINGLPDNLWTVVSGHLLRRMGGPYFSGQGFAISFLILIPVVTFLAFGQASRPSRKWLAALALCWAALLLSITRMTILAAGIEMFITILLIRRYKKALNLILIGICVGIAIIILNPDILNYLLESLVFKTSSSLTHIQAWSNGIKAFLVQPFGSGLGMTDQVATRFRLPVLTGDNLFFKYLVELGIVGFLLHIGLLLFILFGGLLMVRSQATPLWKRGVVVTVISVTVGILVNGQTAVLYSSNFFSYIYWWLAGCSIAWIAMDKASNRLTKEQPGELA